MSGVNSDLPPFVLTVVNVVRDHFPQWPCLKGAYERIPSVEL